MNSNNQNKEYIWHCPGDKCYGKGTIILKTGEPYLGNGSMRCYNCLEIFSFHDITIANIRNIQKLLTDLESY